MPKRASNVLAEGVRYMGRVTDKGERCGTGTLVFEDGVDSTPSGWLRGHWVNDQLEGFAEYSTSDGRTVRGFYTRGSLRGMVMELFADGSTHFVGEYTDGARGGYGVELGDDGGSLEGNFTADGVLHGSGCFYYPSTSGGALVGRWELGRMVSGRFVHVPMPSESSSSAGVTPPSTATSAVAVARAAILAEGMGQRPGQRRSALPALPRPEPRTRRHRYGPGTPTTLPAEPLLVDPHEAETVRAGPSSIPGAGTGLFARRRLAAGEVTAFFTGTVRKKCADGDGDTKGTAVPSAHSVDLDDVVIDLPASLLAEGSYEASSGHLVNFSFSPNVELVPFDHPRFGDVAAVRVRPGACLSGGNELLLDFPFAPTLGKDPAEVIGEAEDVGTLPTWFTAYATRKDEEGYYYHLRMTPEEEILRVASPEGAHGVVRVLAHGPWRVLYLGRVEQGMTYVPSDGASSCDPGVIGFDYVRTAAAVLVGACGLRRRVPAAGPGAGVVCIGLGAGSLPAFLAHHFPWLPVRVVELDVTVVAAARDALRNPLRFHVDVGDGQEGLRNAKGTARAVFLDAYDGQGRVPVHLRQETFLRECAAALVPGGILATNVFHGEPGSAAVVEAEAFATLVEKHVGPVHSVVVGGQHANLILVAMKGQATRQGATAALQKAVEQTASDLASEAAQGVRPVMEEAFLRVLRALAEEPSRGFEPYGPASTSAAEVR